MPRPVEGVGGEGKEGGLQLTECITPGHTHTEIQWYLWFLGSMSSKGVRDQDPSCEAVPTEGWVGSGVNGAQKDGQDHRKSGAVGKYPTWLATPPPHLSHRHSFRWAALQKDLMIQGYFLGQRLLVEVLAQV